MNTGGQPHSLMVRITAEVVPEKKYKLAPSYQELTEAEIISRCLSGVLGRKTLYFESQNPSSPKISPISTIPAFEEAIAKYEVGEKLELVKHSPDRRTRLLVRTSPDATPTGEYLADQIRNRLIAGELPASSEFKHPEHNEWFSCVRLLEERDGKLKPTPIETVIAELGLLKAELIEVKAQTAKTKWAVRGVAFLLILLVYCGFRIVVRITA